ncbi:Nematocin receptor 2 [Holothuria leucospilota]|uniref:Nematocin receptor 2 n=1 Tax=Holothuria leucospilota TaxID=206669 RepID=A0A9Q0YNP8_HOLLE|nr:Nematocin receptor 2 [Holothuria leucospilota]
MHLYAWIAILYRFLISTFGIPGNILILIVYSRRKSIGSAQFFIKTLAIADLYVCLLLPFNVYYYVFQLNYTNNFICKISMTTESFGWYVSVFLTVAVAADRYVAICRPLTGRWSRRKAAVIVACSVLLAFILVTPEALVATTALKTHPYYGYNYTTCLPNGENRIFANLVVLPRVLSPFVALPTLAVIYIKVWRKVHRQKRQIGGVGSFTLSGNVAKNQTEHDSEERLTTQISKALPSVNGDNSTKNRDTETVEINDKVCADTNAFPQKTTIVVSRLTKMLLVTTLVFSLTWFLSVVLFSLKSTTDKWYPDSAPAILVSTVRLCPVINHAINPVIYSFTNKQFLRDCKRLCRS